MDNSQNDYSDNFKLKGRFGKKPNKMKTVMQSDGTEKIVAVKSSRPRLFKRKGKKAVITEPVVQLPQITEAAQVETVTNPDGSETLINAEQPIEPMVDVSEETQENGEDNLRGKHKKKRPMKKLRKKIGSRIKRPTKKTVGEEALKFTKPLVKAMKIGLADRGLNTSSMSNVQIIEKFYNEFVSKKNDSQSNLEPLPEGFLVNHYLMSADYDTFDADHLGSIADIQTVANVGKSAVNKIKGFLQKRKAAKAAKKKPSQVMPKVEAKVSAEAEKVVQQLEKELKEKEPVTKAENKSNIVKYVIFAVVALLLIVVIVKFVKK